MLRNLDAEVLDITGKSLEPKLTLKDICLQACVATLQPDPSQDEKLALWKLAKRVYPGALAEFTAEEITLLKKRIAQVYSISAMGRAFELLEQDPA